LADPDPGSGAFLTPRSGIRDGLKVRIRIRDEQPGTYFLELRNHFFGLKYLISLMRIRDPGWKKFVDPKWKKVGSGMEKSRIRDGENSDPGSGINIPDLQHWFRMNSFP
jgi:hypothetical protein